MERMGSKIIELHKISKKFKDHVIMDNFSSNRENALELSGKMERENQPFKFIDCSHLMAGEW
jgi:hypothetical protein